MRRFGVLVLAGVTALAVAVGGAFALGLVGGESRPAPFDAWPDSTFGAVVLDANTGAVRSEYRPHEQFRSASLVKLLIAVDVLERPGVADADRRLVTSMLRTSDDDAASVLWARFGAAEIVARTAGRLGLADTELPASRSSWGYTATSAADVARTLSYLRRSAPAAVRDAVLGDLRATSRCAVDGRDQLFGVGRSTGAASKQGWSGFGRLAPGTGCTPTPPSAVDPAADDRARTAAGPAPSDTGSDPDVDVEEPAMHTGGVLGDGTVVVVLSLHPDGTSFDDAARIVDDAARALSILPVRQ